MSDVYGVGQKDVTTPPSMTPPFSPAGLFDVCGLEREVINAAYVPRDSLAAALPVRATEFLEKNVGLITSIGGPTGTEADGVCDPGEQTGVVFGCVQNRPLGRYPFRSPSVDVDSYGLRTNRGVFNDQRVVGGGASDMGLGVLMGGAAADDLALGMQGIAYGVATKIAAETYTANPANNSANGGTRRFKGLEMLVNTGQLDIDGVACPAVDSLVTAGGTVDEAFVAKLLEVVAYLGAKSDMTNIKGVTWALVMRPEMFHVLSALWPCSYVTAHCGNDDLLSLNAATIPEQVNAMRAGKYLMVNGQRIRVITDSAIPMTATGNAITADMYVVPMSIMGGMSSLFWDARFYNMSGGVMEHINRLGANDAYWTTDGGKYLWVMEVERWCIQFDVKVELRLMLSAPQLAARLTGCVFETQFAWPAWNTNAPGYVGGGVAVRS